METTTTFDPFGFIAAIEAGQSIDETLREIAAARQLVAEADSSGDGATAEPVLSDEAQIQADGEAAIEMLRRATSPAFVKALAREYTVLFRRVRDSRLDWHIEIQDTSASALQYAYVRPSERILPSLDAEIRRWTVTSDADEFGRPYHRTADTSRDEATGCSVLATHILAALSRLRRENAQIAAREAERLRVHDEIADHVEGALAPLRAQLWTWPTSRRSGAPLAVAYYRVQYFDGAEIQTRYALDAPVLDTPGAPALVPFDFLTVGSSFIDLDAMRQYDAGPKVRHLHVPTSNLVIETLVASGTDQLPAELRLTLAHTFPGIGNDGRYFRHEDTRHTRVVGQVPVRSIREHLDDLYEMEHGEPRRA